MSCCNQCNNVDGGTNPGQETRETGQPLLSTKVVVQDQEQSFQRSSDQYIFSPSGKLIKLQAVTTPSLVPQFHLSGPTNVSAFYRGL